jgi:hypothetical protein
MNKPNPVLTTEVYITACNETLTAIIENQYGRLEAGEARAALETAYGPVWNEDELNAVFEVGGASPPYVSVVARETGKRGTVLRLDSPRFYFLFNPEVLSEVVSDG